jgi:hypothetical protein
MTEPDQIEFNERVKVSGGRPGARSIPVRIGIVAGSAILVVVGAAAAMGASPSSPVTNSQADLSAAVAPDVGAFGEAPLDHRFPGGPLGRVGLFNDITIGAINGSSLSLKTADGWTRTISVGSSTVITKAGQTIAVGALGVGDQIRFSQEKATDGTYTITAIRVILPTLGGEVTAVSGNTITVTGKDGTTGTIHVDGDTTYQVNGTAGKALSDVTVGSFIIAEGTSRTDGSLDADAVHSGLRGLRDGGLKDGERPGRGFPGFPDFPGRQGEPDATPAPSSTAS